MPETIHAKRLSRTDAAACPSNLSSRSITGPSRDVTPVDGRASKRDAVAGEHGVAVFDPPDLGPVTGVVDMPVRRTCSEVTCFGRRPRRRPCRLRICRFRRNNRCPQVRPTYTCLPRRRTLPFLYRRLESAHALG